MLRLYICERYLIMYNPAIQILDMKEALDGDYRLHRSKQ